MLNPENIAFLFFLGCFAGLLAGLLGVGGGLIIVPALLFFFSSLDFSDDYLTQAAVATSLATILFTSISSIRTHHIHGFIDWILVRDLSVGIAIGAFAGAWLAVSLSGQVLQFAFGLFAMLIAMQMFFQLHPKQSRQLPDLGGRLALGSGVAFISSIFGIGGGSLTVPGLSFFGVEIKKAVAVSAACGLPIALFSVAGFFLASLGKQNLPPQSLGYVHLPALFYICLASMVSAHFGAKLAHRLPAEKLKKVFAFFLAIVGLRLILMST